MEQNAMAVREQQWLETIQTAKKSGLPVNQWCHENGIAESTFYRWQQRIRQHLPGSAEPTFVELPEQAKPLTSAQPVHLITVHGCCPPGCFCSPLYSKTARMASCPSAEIDSKILVIPLQKSPDFLWKTYPHRMQREIGLLALG